MGVILHGGSGLALLGALQLADLTRTQLCCILEILNRQGLAGPDSAVSASGADLAVATGFGRESAARALSAAVRAGVLEQVRPPGPNTPGYYRVDLDCHRWTCSRRSVRPGAAWSPEHGPLRSDGAPVFPGLRGFIVAE